MSRLFGNAVKFRDTFVLPKSAKLQWFPGHMKRGMDQIQSSLREIDAVIEVHDARIPFSGRNSNLRQVIHIRPHVLILNKCDLADLSRKDEIVKKIKGEGVNNVLFTSCVSKHITKYVKNDIIPMMLRDVNGRERFRTDVYNRYNILVIGVPNVGKSTLLNKLMETYTKRRKCAQVGAMPGVTRSVMNKVRVNYDPDMYVVDTPGILNAHIPNTEMGMRLALCDCIPNHLVGKEVIVDYLLFWLNKHKKFSYVDQYQMSSPTDDVMDFMMAVALKNKFLQPYKDGSNSTQTKYKINFEKTSSFIIKEFQSGNFGKVMFDDDCLT
ncbi:mitochondrial ribosome-associated GTPase 1-like [Ruditapes philippinarum]|uniref:mitochondrial ribosome-associated GTPase 1-like n=1 Tax=Ruditapes philippinarum TaxID=129788 RepID=UPI00295BE174|nr:mitochondrial ribosome-associated GTPase 1-like [Ruditapes philippinarum]